MWGTGPHPNTHQGDESVPTAAGMQHCLMTVNGTGSNKNHQNLLVYYHHDGSCCCRVCAINTTYNMSMCKNNLTYLMSLLRAVKFGLKNHIAAA